MNKLVKVFLLLLALAGVVTAVMIFVKTRVEMPKPPATVNQFDEQIEGEVSSLRRHGTAPFYLDAYKRMRELIRFQREESLLSESKGRKAQEQLDEMYAGILCGAADNVFLGSEWSDADIKSIKEGIGFVGATVQNTDVKRVNSVIDDYDQAMKIVNNATFRSIADARTKITSAGEYAQKNPLRNNTALVSQLNGVRKKIADSHYAMLNRKINALATYRPTQWDDVVKRLGEIDDELNEYKNAKKLYQQYYSDKGYKELNEKLELRGSILQMQYSKK
ncbi:MAG: hypothetical protein IJ680_03030 [Paludibacteraceae bacterium]|nr:hypothetical protein [Paludibacteraceae bacterium]